MCLNYKEMDLLNKIVILPATLGLVSPLSLMANEINLSELLLYSSPKENIDFNSENISKVKSNETKEVKLTNDYFEAGSFSETTTASFGVDFVIGAADGASSEATTFDYQMGINLKTQFTENDLLSIDLEAGNASSVVGGNTGLDFDSTEDSLDIDGIAYKFQLGDKTTLFVGEDKKGNYLYSPACVYGGQTNNLDDCGSFWALWAGKGTAVGASFDIGNGLSAALSYTGDGTNGLMNSEGFDSYGGQVTYRSDSYGASVTYADFEFFGGSYYWALNGYLMPSTTSLPSVSVGYEFGDTNTNNNSSQYFIGLQWYQFGPGSLGASLGTNGPIFDGDSENLMYEAFYSYPVNDGMTITPVVYFQETSTDDITALAIKTSFRF